MSSAMTVVLLKNSIVKVFSMDFIRDLLLNGKLGDIGSSIICKDIKTEDMQVFFQAIIYNIEVYNGFIYHSGSEQQSTIYLNLTQLSDWLDTFYKMDIIIHDFKESLIEMRFNHPVEIASQLNMKDDIEGALSLFVEKIKDMSETYIKSLPFNVILDTIESRYNPQWLID